MDNGYIVGKFPTKKKNDAMHETIKCCQEDWDIIIACGGDGTVNEIATGVMVGERKIPIAILAAGTVNDFATYMRLPKTAKGFCDMIMEGNIVDVDLGRVNDKYFVNVAAGGLLTNVAHQVPSELKSVLGRIAYYIEGLKEIPKQKFKAIKVNFESEEYNSKDEDIFLFLITNSSSIGGFKRLAPKAQISDGYLDCIIIKKSDIHETITIFLNILKGRHIKHPNVAYFKTKRIKVETDREIHIDVDGEYGGTLPGIFEVVPNSLKIFITK